MIKSQIRPLQYKDIEAAAHLHIKSFPNFFLSFLGHRFLKEFYTAFVNEENSIGLVAVDQNGRVIGTVVGTLKPIGFFRRLLIHRWWAFCFGSIGAFLRNPNIAPRLFRALFYRGDTPSGPPMALLSSVSVDPGLQSKGVGGMLVHHFLKESIARGATGCYLTTDALDNDAVNRFYLKNGWRVESSYVTPEGRLMNRYEWKKSI